MELQYEIPKISREIRAYYEANNSEGLVTAICKLTNEQVLWLRYDYQGRYDESLFRHVSKTTKKSSEYLSEIMRKVLLPRSVYIINEVHDALGKVSSKTTCLCELLSHMDTPLRIELQVGYEETYSQPLDTEFSDELSFNVKKLFMTLLYETNDGEHTIDEDVLRFREMSQSKTNCDEQYIELFGRRSPARIQKLCKAYKDKYNETAEAVFTRETSGAFRELLIDLTTPWAVYWARKIRTYLRTGKKSGIVRCFLMNDSVTFNEITEEYFKRFKKSMYDDAIGKTSGTLQSFVKAKLCNVSAHYKKMETDDLAGSVGDALKMSGLSN